MKIFATSLIVAVMLAATGSSPALAGSDKQTVQPRSGSSCLPNSVRCKRGYRPAHPRCYAVVVVDRSGTPRKKRVCSYS